MEKKKASFDLSGLILEEERNKQKECMNIPEKVISKSRIN